MRGTLPAPHTDAPAHHPRFQEAADDPEQAFVADAPCQAGHQNIVVDPVEKFLEIQIGHDPVALGNVLPRLGERVMSAAPRAETETRRREGRVEDRL